VVFQCVLTLIDMIFLYFLVALLILATALIVFYFQRRLNQCSEELKDEKWMREALEAEAVDNIGDKWQKESLIALYHHIITRYRLIEERLEQLSYKYMKINPEVHQDLQSELTNLKSEFISMLPDLIHDDLFYAFINIPQHIPLTIVEKTILFLLFSNIPSKQVATILAINSGNLRVKRLHLRRKLQNHASEIENLTEIMSII
jgi:DNA-binding CsgD family transcriptional regulator